MSQSKVPIGAIRGLITDALAAAGLPRETRPNAPS